MSESRKTVINPELVREGELIAGVILGEKYQVTEKLKTESGESEIYLCEYQEKRYLAKVYRRSNAVKEEVKEQLQKVNSPYVVQSCDTFVHGGIPIEIMPYYRMGSLLGKTYSFKQLRKQIIPCINEGLKALHDANIIHKDLKPSNLVKTDEEGNVAIIDFGISSITEWGNTVVVTRTGMTPDYAAPETFKGLYLSESDYYSMGITIYELFCGRTPYTGMEAEEIEKYVSIQRIPFPEQMPEELKSLIQALTYYDISNRRDKDNPNRRWGYEEVNRWLAGDMQTIPGEGREAHEIPDRRFRWRERSYDDLETLGNDLLEHLHNEDSSLNEFMESIFKEEVISKYLRRVAPESQEAFELIRVLESTWRMAGNNMHEKQVNLYLTGHLLSGRKVLYIDGQSFYTPEDLADYIKNISRENHRDMKRMYDFCHKLVHRNNELNPALEGWLLAWNHQDAIFQWKESRRNEK